MPVDQIISLNQATVAQAGVPLVAPDTVDYTVMITVQGIDPSDSVNSTAVYIEFARSDGTYVGPDTPGNAYQTVPWNQNFSGGGGQTEAIIQFRGPYPGVRCTLPRDPPPGVSVTALILSV